MRTMTMKDAMQIPERPRHAAADVKRTASAPAGGDLASELRKSFVDGVGWPIDQASLAALLDLGLNVQQIARYFSVTPATVIRLLNSAVAAGARFPVSW